MNEEWRDVGGYEGTYFISNMGQVASLQWGRRCLLKPLINTKGYLYVGLRKNGARKNHLIHRLVLLAFSPIENSGELMVNHIDSNPLNCRIENLEWCTNRENSVHFWRTNRKIDQSKSIGGNHHLSRLTDADVIEIRRIYSERKISMNAVGRMFNISGSTAANILHGKTWRHLLPRT